MSAGRKFALENAFIIKPGNIIQGRQIDLRGREGGQKRLIIASSLVWLKKRQEQVLFHVVLLLEQKALFPSFLVAHDAELRKEQDLFSK